jgi:predicted nucleotidyltransferase component of viral defense system
VIPKFEIDEEASRSALNPTVVEKDYVLGWLLAGIAAHDGVGDWYFKGGTCLKKCYFETYRFSEDLDFTITDPGHLDEAWLKKTFASIADWVYQQSGIEFSPTTAI